MLCAVLVSLALAHPLTLHRPFDPEAVQRSYQISGGVAITPEAVSLTPNIVNRVGQIVGRTVVPVPRSPPAHRRRLVLRAG